jgi:hypothetical protein
LTTVKTDIVNIRIDVITENNVAAPLPSEELRETIIQPLASAKSAIDQMKNHTATRAEIM